MKELDVSDCGLWRAWLAANHERESELWLVFHRNGTGTQSINYNEAVEEALCFGWVDSIIKKLDGSRYARKFTPRKPGSNWSESNVNRATKLIAAGRMAPAGLRLVEAAKASGAWQKPVRPASTFDMPEEMIAALSQNPRAKSNFDGLAPGYQRQYVGWVANAKRPDTRARRIEESIALLENGKKLGMK